MKIKTNELNGAALDWAVAKAEGYIVDYDGWLLLDGVAVFQPNEYQPSTDWAQGGPIIEREKITVVCVEGEYNSKKAGTPDCYGTYWVAEKGKQRSENVYGPQGDDWGNCFQIDSGCIEGTTPLIAAMRCYVTSKLGDEVKVPEAISQQ